MMEIFDQIQQYQFKTIFFRILFSEKKEKTLTPVLYSSNHTFHESTGVKYACDNKKLNELMENQFSYYNPETGIGIIHFEVLGRRFKNLSYLSNEKTNYDYEVSLFHPNTISESFNRVSVHISEDCLRNWTTPFEYWNILKRINNSRR